MMLSLELLRLLSLFHGLSSSGLSKQMGALCQSWIPIRLPAAMKARAHPVLRCNEGLTPKTRPQWHSRTQAEALKAEAKFFGAVPQLWNSSLHQQKNQLSRCRHFLTYPKAYMGFIGFPCLKVPDHALIACIASCPFWTQEPHPLELFARRLVLETELGIPYTFMVPYVCKCLQSGGWNVLIKPHQISPTFHWCRKSAKIGSLLRIQMKSKSWAWAGP